MEALGIDLRSEAHLRTLTEDVFKSSEIEGEKLARDQVRSSIARRLGMDIAGLAHLQFVTIHPFDDGNGRIARAIADMVLARSEKSRQRFYSMSAQIWQERKDYYYNLEWTQKGDTDVTRWLDWFLNCLLRAIVGSEETLDAVMVKARFWDRYAKTPFNNRQIKVMNKLLDGFQGKLTTSKWAKMAKCSQDTAYRDILDLVDRGALQKDPGGGRSTSYSVTGN